MIQLRLAAGNLDRAQLVQINSWLSVAAATAAPITSPENLTPR
jgi:hypothetical protein